MRYDKPRVPNASKTGGHASAVLAGYLGWTLDAFDFFLVSLCVTAIGSEFHKSVAEVSATMTLTLLFRPVGAFLFGLMADRYGRRLPLMLDLIFYSVIEVLSGLAPNFTTFAVLRALFGIGMGGEWGVGATLAMEKVPPRLRGALSGFLQQGYATGNLLASLCYFTLFGRFGWRPLFFLGGLPALLAIFVRMRVQESEVWQKSRASNWSHLWRSVLSHWRLFLYLLVFMTAMNLVAHGTQDLYPVFLERQRGFGVAGRATLNAISMIGAIAGGTLIGFFSDRAGRRRAIVLALFAALAMIPLWAFAPTLTLLVAGAFLMQFFVQGAWGVIPAHLTELSPDSVRGFLPGFGYQCGAALSGSVILAEALFARQTGYGVAMAVTTAVVVIFAVVAAHLGPERKAILFGQ